MATLSRLLIDLMTKLSRRCHNGGLFAVNHTLVRGQMVRAPDRSGPQAPLTKLSRVWPFCVAIFAVPLRNIIIAFRY